MVKAMQNNFGNLLVMRNKNNWVCITDKPLKQEGTFVDNKIVDHSALPVGAAPTTFSFSTQNLASVDWEKTTATRDLTHLSIGIWYDLY